MTAEQSLPHNSEAAFTSLADNISQMVWLADRAGARYWYNKRWYDYSGTTPKEMQGNGWQKIHHADHLERVLQKMQHARDTGEAMEDTFPLKAMNGEYRWFLTRVIPILNSTGEIIKWIGTNTDVNDQHKQAEELIGNVRESGDLMKSIFRSAPDAVITIDSNDIICSWNPQAEAIFGWTENEVLGNTLTKTIFPERYHEAQSQDIKHFLKTGEGPMLNKPIEISAVRKDQTEFYVELKISSAKLHDGFIFIGFIRDITVRKEAEEIIKNKSLQLAEAQQMAHIGSWEWDFSRNKIEWSDELYRIFGFAPHEFKSTFEHYLEQIHPDDRQMLQQTVEQAFKDHSPYDIVHRILMRDGSVRFISGKGKVIIDNAGNAVRMAGTAQDITAQKKYETELKESEERFFKMFDRNPVPMVLAEIKTNTITYANDLFYSAFGYSKEEVVGNTSKGLGIIAPEEYKRVIKLILQLLKEERSIEEVQKLSTEEIEDLLNRLKQTEEMKNFEIMYTRKNGETFPALVSYETMRLGDKSYTIRSYQDITERRKAEVQLKLQNEQLEKMNKELESFAYVSSHDLQEPLRKIQTYVSLITERENDNLSEKGKEQLRRMNKAAKRMRTLIEDLLAFSRTNRNEGIFKITDLDILAAEVKDDLKEELLQKNGTLDVGEMCMVKVISFQMRQLLHNLIGNSLKFSKPDTPPRIKITCESKEGRFYNIAQLQPQTEYFHLRLSDNGIGFEPQYSQKIFEVFQRLHGKDELPGTGIGLAIVKKIVDNHNGVITATGDKGQGATFNVYIPTGMA